MMYRAFGLNIESEIELPEIPRAANINMLTDIDIRKRDLTDDWNRFCSSNQHIFVNEELVFFQIPGVAKYLIRKGQEIYVDPCEDSIEDQVRLFVLGTSIGAALMQRKILPLHGSAVVKDGKAYAILGHSGAGKSTLAATLLQKGFSLISDDLIPVTFDTNGSPMVSPAYPQQKLWQASIDNFGMDSSKLRPIFKRKTKYAVPVLEQFYDSPIQLAGVFELVKSKEEVLNVKEITGMDRLQILFKHTFRNYILKDSQLLEWHFNEITKIVKKIHFFELERPITEFTAERLADLMISKISVQNEVEDFRVQV